MTTRILRRCLLTVLVLTLLLGDIPVSQGDRARPTGRPLPHGAPRLKRNPFRGPVGGPLSTALALRTVSGAGLSAASSTLVLYDTTNAYGWLGELYAIMVVNLASHFGSWTAKPVVSYTAGEINSYSAVIYIGSTYDEPLPVVFLDDVYATPKPVVWVQDNIWQLSSRLASRGISFTATYGWNWSQFDYSSVASVLYKNTGLSRYAANGSGIMNYEVVNPGVLVLARAIRDDGTTFPWALRSRNLTYLGENPFVYMVEGDRVMAFEDLLFDSLAPTQTERHRALVRLEDISPQSDPAELRAIADYLSSRGVPFGFGVIPNYRDPLGAYNGGVPEADRLRQEPAVVEALRYLKQKGGVMIMHGDTHQYSNVLNPYTATSADDFEFYRVTENPDHTLTYHGPVPEDSRNWALNRINSAAKEFEAVKLAVPTIFEFPHYAGSATDYKAVAEKFATRYERSLYFRGLLSGGTIDHTRLAGQRFSYVVRDVYGTKVLPENLGSIEPEPFFQFPTRFPSDIIADARRTLVVRDGVASFYFHPFFPLSYLEETVEGLLALGYTFVSPGSL